MTSRSAQAASTPPLAAAEPDRPATHRLIWLLDRAIFGALLVLLALIAIPYGTAEVWWESFFECAVFALSLLWIVEGLLSGSWLFSHRALLVPVLALIAFCLLQTLPLGGAGDAGGAARIVSKGWYAISADPFETRLFTFKLIALALYGLLLMRYGSRGKRLRILIHVIIGVAVASALFGILRQTTQREMGFFLPFLKKDLGYGQFINQNHFAFLMEMALGLVLGLLVGRGVKRDRMLIYVALLLPIWTALAMCGSRGGLLGMLGQIIFVALLFTLVPPAREASGARDSAEGTFNRLRRMGRSLPVRLALAACLVLAVAGGVVMVGGEPVIGKLEAVHSELDAQNSPLRQNASRKEIWHSTWRLIKANPLAGVGFGGYWAAIPTYHDASGELTPQQAHNDYLELLASGGIIGVTLAAWFVFVFIRRARERLRAKDAFCRAICFGALVALFGVAVHSLVDFGLHITINALVFVALLVIATADCQDAAAGASRPRRSPKPDETNSMALSA